MRDRLGRNEDQFFATVFLGSGLLYLAMLFTSSAVTGGIINMYGIATQQLIESGIYTFGRVVTYEIANIYAMKMAGAFMISTSTLGTTYIDCAALDGFPGQRSFSHYGC